MAAHSDCKEITLTPDCPDLVPFAKVQEQLRTPLLPQLNDIIFNYVIDTTLIGKTVVIPRLSRYVASNDFYHVEDICYCTTHGIVHLGKVLETNKTGSSQYVGKDSIHEIVPQTKYDFWRSFSDCLKISQDNVYCNKKRYFHRRTFNGGLKFGEMETSSKRLM
jgi:hypothetical protein